MKIIATAAAFGLLLLAFEWLFVRVKAAPEATRKLVHITAGVALASLPLFLTFLEIAAVTGFLLIAAVVSMRRQLSVVHGVSRVTYGEVYFPVGVILCCLLFPNTLLFMYAVLVVGVSDALASLVGQMYGHKKFSLWGSHKSYAGSWAFFVTTVVLGALLLLAFTPAPMLAVIITSLLLAAILTFVEAASSKGIDNLLVPFVAGGLMWALQSIGFFG